MLLLQLLLYLDYLFFVFHYIIHVNVLLSKLCLWKTRLVDYRDLLSVLLFLISPSRGARGAGAIRLIVFFIRLLILLRRQQLIIDDSCGSWIWNLGRSDTSIRVIIVELKENFVLVWNHLAKIKALHVTKDLTFDISTSEEEYLAVIQACSMAAPAFRLMSSSVDSYPGTLVDIKQVNVVENIIGLTAAYHTKVRIINSGCCVTSPWGRRRLPRYTWQEPTFSCDIEDKHVIEELVIISAAEDVEATTCALFAEINHGVTCSRRGNSHWTLIIILYLVPKHLCEIETVHIVEEVSQVWATENP